MKTSNNGKELIKKFEGLRLQAYRCPAGILTIGYGHTRNVKEGDKITADIAEKLLDEDLISIERFLNSLKLNINQNQFDALVSFIYNVGIGNFLKSTLLQKIKTDPNDKTIEQEFMKYRFANKIELTGLIRRRKEEVKLYFKTYEHNE